DNEQLAATVTAEADAGNVPIALWHTGIEYTYSPSDYALGRMQRAVDAGAALVIAHHTHVAQGFGRYEGKLLAHSLGNLAFDQQRLETMLGLLVQVAGGHGWRRGARRPGRSLGHRGVPHPPRDRRALGWAPAPGRRVLPGSPGVPRERSGRGARAQRAGRPGGGDRGGGTRLRGGGGAATGPALARPGRDLLIYGTFEDEDIDDDDMEVAHWDVSGGSRFPCHIGARRGAVGVCSVRTDANIGVSTTAFRNRIRVMGDGLDEPNKDLTLVGYAKGDNAGPMDVIARYYASEGEAVFGQEVAFRHPGGTFDWSWFAFDLSMGTVRPTLAPCDCSYARALPRPVKPWPRGTTWRWCPGRRCWTSREARPWPPRTSGTSSASRPTRARPHCNSPSGPTGG
ncbi:MAG: CapA family protein, partial [Deltaproteobacteria bacterium]|nr:CapA family protein [Deltaproteobacteria bacterium]